MMQSRWKSRSCAGVQAGAIDGAVTTIGAAVTVMGSETGPETSGSGDGNRSLKAAKPGAVTWSCAPQPRLEAGTTNEIIAPLMVPGMSAFVSGVSVALDGSAGATFTVTVIAPPERFSTQSCRVPRTAVASAAW